MAEIDEACLKRHLTVLFPFSGDSLGGSHISALQLIRELRKHPDINVVVVLHGRGALRNYLEEGSQPFVIAPEVDIVCPGNHLDEIVGIFKAAHSLSKFLKKEKIDIVHTNDLRMHLTWLLASRIAGCKMIWHQRTASKNWKLGFYSSLASRVLTISQHCLKRLPSSMGKKAKIINDPVLCYEEKLNRRECKEALLKEISASHESVIICWIANWVEGKRPNDFIKTARYVIARSSAPIYFLMFGEMREPAYSDSSDLIKKLDLGDVVIPMGFKVPVEPYIMGSDMLVATAVNEGLGRTLIEALVCKTPVLATNDGGHKEIIKDDVNGKLVPVGDIEALGKVILAFLENPEPFDKMSKISAYSAIEKYSVESHASQVLRIYYSL